MGEGDNIVLGDDGAIDYVREERDGDVPGADTDASDIDLILSLSTTDGGGADDIDSGSGDDIIIGGRFGDIIDAGDGDNLVFGDSGEITAAQADTTRRGSQPLTLMTLGRIKTTEYADGGADDITTGDGSDIVLGGISGNEANGDDGDPDVIRSGAGADIVLGDNGTLIYDEAMSPDPATLDQVTTTQPTDGGADEIYGGSGNDFIFGGTGGDKIYGDNGSGPDQDLDGNDLIFGDHGLVSGIVLAVDIGVANARFSYDAIDTLEENLGGDDLLYGNGGLNIILGQQGSDKIYGGDNDDDLIGGHNVPDGYDGADFIDGGAGNDVILGDNGSILRSASATDPRFTVLEGTQIYNDNSFALVEDGNSIGANPAGVEARRILLFDHDNSAANNGNFGDDTIAGGADDDVIFGQLGDDQIHGDGLLDGTTLVTLTATITGSDIGGDDYIEGNGGSDLIYGGLGQDDIVGGSSNLYNLNDSSMRPDADDTIFGGNGDLIGRNNYGVVDLSGNVVEEAHARDSDMILGDNGNIFRLVGINGEDSSIFLSFNYDNYSDAQKIVVRAAQLLDYTPGGFDYDASKADKDNGAADIIRGESGDDFIYGMVGSDILFGDAQDDDIIGGYGYDWISGGTGDDGVLGDDGRIYTSRNSATVDEPLYGIGIVTVDLEISTPGNIQVATINQDGALKKTANLAPFNLDKDNENPLFKPSNANDIIYGGLGSDFLHGGAGDDAISGAEALTQFYNNPQPQENVLRWGEDRAGEFAAYDEYNPRLRIVVDEYGSSVDAVDGLPGDGIEFLLNFDHEDSGAPLDIEGLNKTDGDDRIFGDLGNDWLVGGTGRDHGYGGRGDDLINMDDNHDSNDKNDIPDTAYSYEDIAYGGAGRDIMIGNTGGDRLIDWAGEFNSYIVPFAPFGLFTISRSLQPQLMEYLYDLAEADGADQTWARR